MSPQNLLWHGRAARQSHASFHNSKSVPRHLPEFASRRERGEDGLGGFEGIGVELEGRKVRLKALRERLRCWRYPLRYLKGQASVEG